MRGIRDDAARRKVLRALAAGKSVTSASRAGGVSRQTVYSWARRGDEEVAQALGLRSARSSAPARASEVLDDCPTGEQLIRKTKRVLDALLDDECAKIRTKAAELTSRLYGAQDREEPALVEGDDPADDEIDPDAAAARFRLVD